ncbi:hypothetical protein [Microseira sp. BLCC-F43]|uniref:hypothetical protein n=1 Tax=Microseira sp. BLCC-F43 TaxID=3153602 RepID=UPI0035BAA4B7
MRTTSTLAQILSNQTLKGKRLPPRSTTVSLRQVFESLNFTVKQQPRFSEEVANVSPSFSDQTPLA